MFRIRLSNFHSCGYSYAILCWGLFTLYCIWFQATRLYSYWLRQQRIKGIDRQPFVMPGTSLYKKCDFLVRIPFVTNLIAAKHIVGVFILCVVNVLWSLWAPFVYNDAGWVLPAVGLMDRRLAFIAMVNWDFAIIFGTRNNIITHMSGLTYESLIPFHRWLGRLGLAEYVLHVVWRIIAGYQRTHVVADSLFRNTEYTTGTISTLGYLLMYLTSFEYVRRNHFEVFYYSHIFGFIIGTAFACWHETTCFLYFIPCIIFWLLDRAVRSYRSWFVKSTPIRVDETVAQTATQEGILRVLFEQNGFNNFAPGQYGFFAIASKANKWWQFAFASNWRPFTISEIFRGKKSDVASTNSKEIEERVMSGEKKNEKGHSEDSLLNFDINTPEGVSQLAQLRRRAPGVSAQNSEESILATVHIKGLGNYTRRILRAAAAGDDFAVKVDGPYGTKLDYRDHKVIACYALGIGATPAMTLIKDCVERRAAGVKTVTTEHIYFIWCVRVSEEYTSFMDMLAYWNEKCKSAILPISLTVFIHVTRQKSGENLLEGYPGSDVFYGTRPDIPGYMQMIEDEEKQRGRDHSHVYVHTCGTDDFMRTVWNTALKHDWDTHRETFDF
ncbi:ferric reductase like transmembrane component-domain-containing protein [Phycomyces blakesleeanus]